MSYNNYMTDGQFKFLAKEFAIAKFDIKVNSDATSEQIAGMVQLVKTSHRIKTNSTTFGNKVYTNYIHGYTLFIFDTNKNLVAKSVEQAGSAINQFSSVGYAIFLATLKLVEDAE